MSSNGGVVFSSKKLMFTGGADVPAPTPTPLPSFGLLFDRSSWAGIAPSPYLAHMDRAADRWGAFVRYQDGIVSAIQDQPGLSSW